MPRKPSPPRADLPPSLAVAKAALLAGVYKLSQADIAERLGVSQSTVSRLLDEATHQGLLVRTVAFPADLLEREPYQRLHAELLLNERLQLALRRASAMAFRRVVVTPTRYPVALIDPAADASERRLARQRFAAAAAPALAEATRSAQRIGVAWGSTLAGCIHELGRQLASGAIPRRRDEPIGDHGTAGPRVVPLAGELSVSGGRADYGSTSLAHALHQALFPDGPTKPPPALTGLLAFLPFVREDVGGHIWHKLHPEGHRAIFGDDTERGWIAGVDCIITGISDDGMPFGDRIEQLTQATGRPLAEIRRAFVGDIGGVLMPNGSEGDLVELLAGMWTGVRRSDLEGVARAAAANASRPGVVSVAYGPRKARCLLQAVRRNLITTAIVDESLAEAVLALLEPEAQAEAEGLGAPAKAGRQPARPRRSR